MKKFAVVIAVVSMLIGGAALPADAQTGDPVGLIASAAIMPFWSTGGYFTVFELTSLADNSDMHAFFFNAACNRVFSIPFRMSEHDALVFFGDEVGLDFDGLLAVAKSTNNVTAESLSSPITARSHRVNILADTIGVVDAIGAANAEDVSRTWNPLRSAASTITFPDNATTWWFVCPQSHVTVDVVTDIPKFPAAASLIRFRVYDLDETPLFDGQLTCTCLTKVVPAALYPFAFALESRYVELATYVSAKPIKDPPAFVLYRQLRFDAPGGFHEDDFGRAPGMSAATLFSGIPYQLER
jgi:hypothetical protein